MMNPMDRGTNPGTGSERGSAEGLPGKPEANSGFGLLAWLEGTRVALPLKGVEARFEVIGEVAHVEIDQIFHQNARVALDCVYTFPLPAEAAIHRCEIHVDDRVIAARIEEQGEAHRQFAQAKADGRRAALVEAERNNLFTLSLANVQPDEVVVVRLAYLQTLERLGEERRLRIPFCPGIRYIAGQPLLRPNRGSGIQDDTDAVPDASRLSPPRLDRLHRDAAYVAVSGVVRAGSGGVERMSSASHALTIRREADAEVVNLAGADGVPDQDFQLAWEPRQPEALVPRAWAVDEAGWRYALVELRAPALGSKAGAARAPLDVYFLLDCSGSMGGDKWSQACEAMGECARALRPEDRVWVTCFATHFTDYSEMPIPVGEFLAADPVVRLQSCPAGGGTELVPALRHVVAAVGRHSQERKPVLVLVTDGQVGDEAGVSFALAPVPQLVVHAFGIDTVVNDALLTQVARQQRGRAIFLRPEEDVVAAVRKLGSLLSAPVVTDLGVPVGWESADGPLPDLYAGEHAVAVLRTNDQKVRGRPLALAGRTAVGEAVHWSLEPAQVEGPGVRLLWGRRRLLHLTDRGALAEGVAVAKEFNLLAPGTAFVAWDTLQRVAVAETSVYQPSLQPHLWQDAAAVFGAIRTMASSSPTGAMGTPPFVGSRSYEEFSIAYRLQDCACEAAMPAPKVKPRQKLASNPAGGGSKARPEVEVFLRRLRGRMRVFRSALERELWAFLEKWLSRDQADLEADMSGIEARWTRACQAGKRRREDELAEFARSLFELIGESGPAAEELREILARRTTTPAEARRSPGES